MEHPISQAPATVVLCNRLHDKLSEIQVAIHGLAKLDPSTDALLTYSLLLGWCGDSRALVMEIKSQL